MGTQIVIPYRDEDDKRHLKLTGDLGQVVPMVGPLLRNQSWTSSEMTTGMGYTKRIPDRGMSATFRYSLQFGWQRLRDQVDRII